MVVDGDRGEARAAEAAAVMDMAATAAVGLYFLRRRWWQRRVRREGAAVGLLPPLAENAAEKLLRLARAVAMAEVLGVCVVVMAIEAM